MQTRNKPQLCGLQLLGRGTLHSSRCCRQAGRPPAAQCTTAAASRAALLRRLVASRCKPARDSSRTSEAPGSLHAQENGTEPALHRLCGGNSRGECGSPGLAIYMRRDLHNAIRTRLGAWLPLGHM